MFNSNRVLAFCNLHEAPNIGGFNKNRHFGSVTFLGRYAIMDFTLSNFANSRLDRVYLLVDKFYHSILNHVGGGQSWTLNTKVGYQKILYNEKLVNNPNLNNDINNLRENMSMYGNEDFEYVVIAPCHYLSSMNFRTIIQKHIDSNSDITAVYAPIHEGKKIFTKSILIDLNEDGTVKKFKRNTHSKDEVNASLDTYIISRKTFFDLIEKQKELSNKMNLNEVITHLVNEGKLKVDTYCFEHYVMSITNMKEYIDGSFSLLRYDNRRKLFKKDWPINTTTHDTPPALYGPNADVEDAIVSNGCMINGKVKHCILSRDVIVEKGASLTNCIIFTKSVIKKGVTLENVCADKNTLLDKDISGDNEAPIFVGGNK